MSFARALAIADAVLLEGYVLYPYRASALKNRYRWSFGVLAPRAFSDAGGGEAWWLESQFLVEGAEARLSLRLRFLQLQRRRVSGAEGVEVERLEAGERLLLPWDEGVTREVDVETTVPLATRGSVRQRFDLPGGVEVEEVTDAEGVVVGRVTRERWPVRGGLQIVAEPAAEGGRAARIRVRVENTSASAAPPTSRDEALQAALLSTHLLARVEKGAFVSLMDPPAWARDAASACRNVGTYPVLAGEEGRRDLLLSSPIILYDHPQIAPESPGDFFDATEIDELLTLRTRTLTDDEKRQVRATDERSARVLDRVESLPPAWLERLHGAVRDLSPCEDPAARPLAPGARVRLKPGKARTDAQDLLYAGRIARVEKVEHDVDGRVFVAVTIEGDPAAELHRWYGRYHYYTLDEVERLSP